MSVSIIITVYNALPYAQACVESIYRVRTNVPFEVIIVNNGSRPDVREWLAREQECRPNFQALHFDQPLGFACANNIGARQARHEFLVLQNSDTVVTDGWLDHLMDAMAADRRLGVVAPMSNSVGSELQLDPEAASLYSHQANSYAERIRNRREVAIAPQRVVFFSVMIRRTLWEWLGGLEEAYGTGNFEDDDFCLRARLAGHRLGVARNSFVFHHEQATFRANNLDHRLLMERNQLLFCKRASRWSRSLDSFGAAHKDPLASVSVILPVLPGCGAGLRDSLASLASQTVERFETVVVSSPEPDIADAIADFKHRLRITSVQIVESRCDELAVLLNAGLAAAQGEQIAYLAAGDIFYPYHLELLASVLRGSRVDAAYASWGTVELDGVCESRGVVQPYELVPERLALGDRAPLSCWLHSRSCVGNALFDESFQTFAPWEFLLRVAGSSTIQYLPRMTWERRVDLDRRRLHPLRMEEARRVMAAFPIANRFHLQQRARFLKVVEAGDWETSLTASPISHECGIQSPSNRSGSAMSFTRSVRAIPEIGHRALRGVYRAILPLKVRYGIEREMRALLGLPPIFRGELKTLQQAHQRLAQATIEAERLAPRCGPPDVVLFSTIEWDHLTQRPHQLARELVSRGFRIFWVDVQLEPPDQIDSNASVRALEPGIFGVALPSMRGDIYGLVWDRAVLETMEMAMAHLRAVHGVHQAIQIINFPKWSPLSLLLRDRFGWPIVYDCLDHQKAFAELYRLDAGRYEDELMKKCDLLVASSAALYKENRALNPNAILINNACDYSLFSSATPSGLLAHLPHPIAGFFGAFGDWLDFDWIEESARRFPDWSFVYIGRDVMARRTAQKRWKEIIRAKNIHVFPQVGLPELAAYLAEFDVCLMPFQNLPVTQVMNPVKIYEYLAAGKAVVAPDLAETRQFADRGLIATYRDREDSFRLLHQAGSAPPTPTEIAARQSFAAQNTWSGRVEKLIANLPLMPEQSRIVAAADD
jgi:GT2 family glycosyltransferase/glycosyltransferase involved in cell wall biosynthesis